MEGPVGEIRRGILPPERCGKKEGEEGQNSSEKGDRQPGPMVCPPPFAGGELSAMFPHHLNRNGTVPRKEESIWYRLGWALEEVMASLPPRMGGGRSPAGRQGSQKGEGSSAPPLGSPIAGVVLSVGSTLLTTALARWVGKRAFPLGMLTRGALAGAGAAGAVLALRILLRREEEGGIETLEEVGDELLAGAGRGVLYAALLHPYLPGPPLLRGALAGSADYLASPVGGLFSSLQHLSPVRKLPILSALLETGDAEEDPYLTFLLHGTILGLLYGGPTRKG